MNDKQAEIARLTGLIPTEDVTEFRRVTLRMIWQERDGPERVLRRLQREWGPFGLATAIILTLPDPLIRRLMAQTIAESETKVVQNYRKRILEENT